MISEQQARDLARQWINAWNAHDIDAILAHYADDVISTSPVAAKLLNDPAGTVKGKASLRQYFLKGLAAYPDLKFNLKDVFWGLNSVVLTYDNQKGSRMAEYFEINSVGKICRIVANYND